MKLQKVLPLAAVGLCVPGVALRGLHLLNGFDFGTGLPAVGDRWFWFCVIFFVLSAAVCLALSLPLRQERETPFETLLGTRTVGFRMAAVIAGLLLMVSGAAYLYFTLTVPEEDAAAWAHILEYVYGGVTLLTGASLIGLAKAQGTEMTARSAGLTLAPLIWSCLHLLVTYRLTCVDPKLPSFTFGLIADIAVVLACYHLARLLYGAPRPASLAFFGGLAWVLGVSDLGGYGLAWLMGQRAVEWPAKTLLRSGMTVAVCILLLAELCVMTRGRSEE